MEFLSRPSSHIWRRQASLLLSETLSLFNNNKISLLSQINEVLNCSVQNLQNRFFLLCDLEQREPNYLELL